MARFIASRMITGGQLPLLPVRHARYTSASEKGKPIPVPENDPRLNAAELSEDEFVGHLIPHCDNNADGLLEVYRKVAPWNSLPDHPLIQPREAYSLRYDPHPRGEPLVFLVFQRDLVGVFENDTLIIDPDHRGAQLSRELILAGFAQAPWKNLKNRKVTKAGAAALRSAHKFARVTSCSCAGMTGMKWFSGILREATARIAPEYFLLAVHGGSSVYRERVYCYELYHQIRLLWPGNSPYRLNGEIDKRAHPYFREGGEPKPDLLVHEPGSGNNYCVVEVKSCRGSKAGIEKDMETLRRFTTEIGYSRAVYLIYGERAAELMTVIKQAVAIQTPVEVWLHPAPGQPAHFSTTE